MPQGISFARLAALLGKSEAATEVAEVCRALGDPVLEESANYRCLEYKGSGVSLVFKSPIGTAPAASPEGTLLEAIHLFGQGVEGHTAYGGQLPFGIQLGDSAEDVRAKAPGASESGGAYDDPLLGRTRAWLRFVWEGGVRLRVEFDEEDTTAVLATLDQG